MRWYLIAQIALLGPLIAVHSQSDGAELHNNVMPASGAMGGTSFSRPQDVQSAINGNPATMTQFAGTTTGFGGVFIEPTVNINQSRSIPLLNVDPYSGKSDTPASLAANIGVIQQIELMGQPISFGLGLITNAGLGVDFRPIDASNGTHVSYLALDLVNALAVEVAPDLTVGGSITIGTSIMDGPFVGASSSQTDYATRFTLGANYELGSGTSIGGFWQSKKDLTFDNVIEFASGPLAGVRQDMRLEHPMNLGVGIANRSLMNGRLLLAADVIYKNWADAEFFKSIYNDQWMLQLGTQYAATDRCKLRMGYAVNEDPTRDTVPGTIGGVVPVGGVPAVEYLQAQFAVVTQHRLTGGIGLVDVMPNTDFDIAVGGVFNGDKTFGSTTIDIEGYYVAFGFTFRPSVGCCR
ncbi:outer membrane protein transport protein [Stieleria sp. TO1_6]|uniref:OmpP1/FadL family transporter n=1 Tax=Stieleria tagensis TaxID=2956795 RepID=UPI00209AAC48|nr:outer membrane protein transport protein [Stieleria tagensis]MCO8123744.1 outer membrane protein transport protein [Stieleria tagensis]